VEDLEPLIGSLSQSPTLVGYTRVKEGYGRLDYSAWSESVVNCPALHLNKQKPIVVLADVTSVSCAELATMLIKALPNGTFIGERTYGAIGGLYSGGSTNIYHDLFYSGCFGDYEYFENGPDPYRDNFSYYVYTSTFHMVDNTYGDVEGVGVQPDIEIRFNLNRLDEGTDNQLDRAIRFIRVGH
jgi:C-terminal processing protease CtpA/Prc